MAKKRAFITGITGQDGSYLAELLLAKSYRVAGLVRRSSNDPLVRLTEKTRKGVTLHYGDLRDSGALHRALALAKPDEVYNLAAQSDVGISFSVSEETFEINCYGLNRLIRAAVAANPRVRIYHASTSEMFGSTRPPQNERSAFHPVSPYGESKLAAYEDYVVGYRERHGLCICSGILFNHESPRRGEHFVTRKITLSLAKIKLGRQRVLELGNLDARRDWGYAPDYVEAMWRMLRQRGTPKDYVIATGETHSVREFLAAAARALEMPLTFRGKGVDEVALDERGRVVVRVNKKFYRPREVRALRGDPRRAARDLKWKPHTTFEELVGIMARADLERAKTQCV